MKTRDSGMPPESYWETFFSPSEILTTLELHRAEGPVVDIAAGYGTFTFAAARLTGQQVIALDIERSLLEDLSRKARTENLHNVQTMLRDVMLEGTGLPDGYADVVLVFNLLHCEHPVDLLKEVRRTLRPEGRVGVLHWRCDISTPRGPDYNIRPTLDQCAAWLREAGFGIAVPRKMLPPYHFGLVGGPVARAGIPSAALRPGPRGGTEACLWGSGVMLGLCLVLTFFLPSAADASRRVHAAPTGQPAHPL